MDKQKPVSTNDFRDAQLLLGNEAIAWGPNMQGYA